MKVFITGGTGFIGKRLIKKLDDGTNHIKVLTRSTKGKSNTDTIEYIEGDPKFEGKWQDAIFDADWIINLVGRTIGERWTEEIKKEIIESRILSTRHVVDAIPNGSNIVFFSTSAVGYYGFRGDEDIYEDGENGSDFLATVAKQWEEEALKASAKCKRVVITRFGLVLGENGGFLEKLIPIFKKYLGGKLGTGNQWLSWVHIEDLVNALLFIFRNDDLSGPINVTSPEPIKNEEFTRILAKVLGVKAIFPVPSFVLKIVLGEFADNILNGQKVLPKKLLGKGFQFKYRNIEEALSQVLGK